MQIFIKCGGDECGREFKGDTGQPDWTCPYCGREVRNAQYPFLCARLMEAKSHPPEETNWKELLDHLLRKARLKYLENNMRLRENGLEASKLDKLIEYENRLDEEGLDWYKITQDFLKECAEEICEQERRFKDL